MAHYRKVDTQIGLDRKFNALPRESKCIFYHLLTHLHLTSLGAMKATLPGLACELDWPWEEFKPAFQVLCEQGMVYHDPQTHFLWLPQFLKYNAPESPNAIRAWESAFSYLPACDLKTAMIHHARAFVKTLPANFQDALPDEFNLECTDTFPDAHLFVSNIAKNEANQPLGNPQATLLKGCGSPAPTLSEGCWNPVSPLEKGAVIPDRSTTDQHAHPKIVVEPGSQRLDHLTQMSTSDLLNAQIPPQAEIPYASKENQPFGSPQATLAKGSGNPAATLTKPWPIQGTITKNYNKEQRANNKEQELKQKEEEIVLETNSEEKNNRGEIKNIVAPTRQKTARPPDAEVIDVFRCWQRTLGHPQAQLDAKRRKIIRRAFASGYNFAQLSEAIKGCSQTPHNMGENEQGQRYDGLHIIFRDADQIDRFIRNANSPPQRRTKADQLISDNVAAGDRWLAKKQQQAEKEINAIN